jgi:hypothetical protein
LQFDEEDGNNNRSRLSLQSAETAENTGTGPA